VDSGAGHDAILVEDAVISRDTRVEVNAGDGDDRLDLDDTRFDDDVFFSMGSGDDVVRLGDCDFRHGVWGDGAGGDDDLQVTSGADFREKATFRGFEE
jgi:hypothetical protein